ncbi:hypothetical protein [Lysobacter gummosus]
MPSPANVHCTKTAPENFSNRARRLYTLALGCVLTDSSRTACSAPS